MRTLLSDRLAPVTSQIGYLRLPLRDAAAGLADWRHRLYPRADTRPVRGNLADLVGCLEPLTGGSRARELLLATSSPEWTANLDCALTGTDADTAVGQLCFDLGCTGVTVASVPHTVGTGLEDPGRYGAVQMSLYGPLQTGFLNQVRTVSVAHDGNQWRFDADGKVLALPQAQARFEIRPGADECVPG